MDFLNKTMMARHTKFPRIIQVKPYSGSTSDDEGEKENHNTRETSPFSSIREKTPAVRARSLEHLPGNTTSPEATINRLKSFDRKYGRSLGSPDLTPIFTATSPQSFTIKNSNIKATDDLQPQKSPVKRWAKW